MRKMTRKAYADASWHNKFYFMGQAGSSLNIPSLFQLVYTTIETFEEALTRPRNKSGGFDEQR